MNTLIQTQKSNPILTSIAVLTFAVLFPMVVHLIPPVNGIPIGAYLLPMFYIPLLTLVLFGKKLAYLTAIFAPVINFAIAGNNNWEFMSVLTIELVIFTAFSVLLIKKLKMLTVPLGIVMAKLTSSIFIGLLPLLPVTPLNYFQSSLYNGLPGIFLLTLLVYFVLKYTQNSKAGNPSV